MGWFTGAVLFSLIWWVVLFAVLPVGVRPQAAADQRSGWRGTPEHPAIGRKLVITSLIAVLLWAGCVAIIESPYLSFRKGWLALPDDP